VGLILWIRCCHDRRGRGVICIGCVGNYVEAKARQTNPTKFFLLLYSSDVKKAGNLIPS